MATRTRSSAVSMDTNPNKRKIRIRMYRVGFGDCFLLSLPSGSGAGGGTYSHILIDCGVHVGGDIGTIERIVDNIGEITDRKLAVIIATHAHRDHISGFGKFAESFSQFKVREVWLPWTWDENDEEAVKLQEKHNSLTAKLFQHFSALGQSADLDALAAVENLRGNKKAIESLKSAFGNHEASVRYLRAGDILNPRSISIAGLSVRVLGPPDSEEFLRQMNPPTGQRYLRLGPDGKEDVDDIHPFVQKWIAGPAAGYLHLSPDDEGQLQETVDFSLYDLTFALDQARNNESLVTLFEFRSKYILFTGDAQYGNWRYWLENERSADDILSQINFLKIAHHGSDNATPKMALEKMSDGSFAAMVSTQSKPFESIPRVPLMAKLSEKTGKKIVRSDWLSVEDAPKPLVGTEPPEPSKLPQGFSRGDLWFDYTIEL